MTGGRRATAVGLLAVVVGLAVGGLGLARSAASLRAGPSEMVSDDPEVAINSNTSPIAEADPQRPGVLVAAADHRGRAEWIRPLGPSGWLPPTQGPRGGGFSVSRFL